MEFHMYRTINGWTKESMKAQIRAKMTTKSMAETGNGGCLYRSTVNGVPTACAVGCFIPDKDYTPSLEGNLPGFQYVGCDWKESTKDIKFPLDSKGLLAMQCIHDGSKQANPADEVCDWVDANVEDGK
jgi:hypothetical protein